MPVSKIHIARSPDGQVWLVEDGRYRPVSSGILSAALEQLFGTAQAIAEPPRQTDLGVPVEVLQAPTGPPFVVIDGHRHPVRGLPAITRLRAEEVENLGDGSTLDIARANVARARAGTARPQPSTSPASGILGTTKRQVRRIARRLKRALNNAP